MLLTQDSSKGIMEWLSKHFAFIQKFQSVFNFIKDKSVQKPKKILLIDEIDVLFDKNYYGDTFNQAIYLRDPLIRSLF